MAGRVKISAEDIASILAEAQINLDTTDFDEIMRHAVGTADKKKRAAVLQKVSDDMHTQLDGGSTPSSSSSNRSGRHSSKAATSAAASPRRHRRRIEPTASSEEEEEEEEEAEEVREPSPPPRAPTKKHNAVNNNSGPMARLIGGIIQHKLDTFIDQKLHATTTELEKKIEEISNEMYNEAMRDIRLDIAKYSEHVRVHMSKLFRVLNMQSTICAVSREGVLHNEQDGASFDPKAVRDALFLSRPPAPAAATAAAPKKLPSPAKKAKAAAAAQEEEEEEEDDAEYRAFHEPTREAKVMSNISTNPRATAGARQPKTPERFDPSAYKPRGGAAVARTGGGIMVYGETAPPHEADNNNSNAVSSLDLLQMYIQELNARSCTEHNTLDMISEAVLSLFQNNVDAGDDDEGRAFAALECIGERLREEGGIFIPFRSDMASSPEDRRQTLLASLTGLVRQINLSQSSNPDLKIEAFFNDISLLKRAMCTPQPPPTQNQMYTMPAHTTF